MEAVNKVINTASTAIWGESNPQSQTAQHADEPVSGVQGRGEANDPYDAGNREEQPGAPSTTAGNTAPQEPRLDGKPETQNESTTADATTDTTTDPAPSTTANTNSEANEQRSSEKTDGESSDADATRATMEQHHVSKEALKGPQGPAPKSAEEFEKDMKRSSGSKDRPSTESAGAESKESEKQGAMSKMKERLGKVAHSKHGGK